MLSSIEEIKEQRRQKRRKYYEENKYKICHNTLNRYCFKSMEQIQGFCPDRVDDYTNRYPFEEYAERYLKRQLCIYEIFPAQDRYADCFDAGLLAYLYSIHRCAAMQYNHAAAYIKKMIRIYIICAVIIYRDAKELCQVNGFQEIRLNAEASMDKY